MKTKLLSLLLCLALLLTGCAQSAPEAPLQPLDDQVKGATEQTKAANEAVYALLDFSDEQELDFAQRGFIAAPDSLEIRDDNGKVIWSQDAYAFLSDEAPDTANPSLWRHTQLNSIYGLFEVAEGIYQVRGYDMTNLTLIRGDTGWIVFDPLMSVECSRAAMELVKEHLGDYPVMAVVISHPHVDHYGGIGGVISKEEAAERNVPIIVPEGFEEHAIKESVYTGNAVARRANYQYGTILTPGETGSLAIGIGMGQSRGATSYITPTDIIKTTGEVRTIDGVEMEFQMTPGTECPAEMNTWFPQKQALWLAENCTGTLHNLYTLRGAQVRDGAAWAEYIMEALTRYGDEAQVVFQSHNWPHFGAGVIEEYLLNTAAVYKFINDQALMYINQGYTGDEIANMIQLPADLEKVWYTRQYYGTLRHNAQAVYQRYMGWYDANPAHLDPLTPTESAKKYVEYLGDVDRVLAMAQQDFADGEYRWVAEITNVLVYADPTNQQARYLCADALEQLGYQAESGPWRNVYLAGAQELRYGTTTDEAAKATGSMDLRKAMTPEMLFGQLGIMLDANAAQELNMSLNIVLTDGGAYLLTVRSGVLLCQPDVQDPAADATLTMPSAALFAILSKNEAAQKESIRIEGDQDVLQKLTEHMVAYEYFFNIVEP